MTPELATNVFEQLDRIIAEAEPREQSAVAATSTSSSATETSA